MYICPKCNSRAIYSFKLDVRMGHCSNCHFTDELRYFTNVYDLAVELAEALDGLYGHTRNNYQIAGINTVARIALLRACRAGLLPNREGGDVDLRNTGIRDAQKSS